MNSTTSGKNSVQGFFTLLHNISTLFCKCNHRCVKLHWKVNHEKQQKLIAKGIAWSTNS